MGSMILLLWNLSKIKNFNFKSKSSIFSSTALRDSDLDSDFDSNFQSPDVVYQVEQDPEMEAFQGAEAKALQIVEGFQPLPSQLPPAPTIVNCQICLDAHKCIVVHPCQHTHSSDRMIVLNNAYQHLCKYLYVRFIQYIFVSL